MSVPPEVPLREFPYNAVVELVNPVADTVSRKTYTGADVDWYVKAEDIVLKNKPEDLSIVATSSVQLEWETVPQAPTYNTLVWESLTPEIASVSETGLVTGLKPGEAKIKVTSMDPDRFSKEFTITVTPVIPISKISFDGVRTEFGYGEVAKLDVKIEPSNATLTALKWESNNQNIVAFDENGVLTVKNTGNVMVTASASYEDWNKCVWFC